MDRKPESQPGLAQISSACSLVIGLSEQVKGGLAQPSPGQTCFIQARLEDLCEALMAHVGLALDVGLCFKSRAESGYAFMNTPTNK